MKEKYWWIILIGLIITVIGIVTKKYLFLLAIFPLGIFYKKGNNN